MNIAIFEHAVTRVKGGMERITIDIANYMYSQGHNILIIADNKKSDQNLVFEYNPGIQVVNFDVAMGDITVEVLAVLKKFNANIFLFVYASNNYLSRFYDVFRLSRIPIIFSEHNNPDYLYKNQEMLFFRNAILSMGDYIHILLKDYRKSLPDILKKRVVVIGNPIKSQTKISKKYVTRNKKKILYVGRINNNPKQINLLVDAFSLLSGKFPDWSLEIWGHGPHESIIRQQISNAGLNGRVFLCGKSDLINEVYQGGDILCLPSKFEGFPLVVGEALSHGLPVVGFGCCSGLNSLVRDGINGLLVNEVNSQALARALECLMIDESLRERMGKEALDSIKQFSPRRIFHQWESLFEKAVFVKDSSIKRIDPSIMSREYFERIRSKIPFYAYPGRYETFLHESDLLTAQLKTEQKLNIMLKSQIDAIYNSRSWSITAPLRQIIKSLRRC